MRSLASSLFLALFPLSFLVHCADDAGTAESSSTGLGGSPGKGGSSAAGQSGSDSAGGSGAGGTAGAGGNGAGQAGSDAGSGGSAGTGNGGSDAGQAGAGAAGSGGGAGASGDGGQGGEAGQGGAGQGGAGQGGQGGAAVEFCNGKDDDGDGQVDEGCDQDGDGYCTTAMDVTPAAACKPGDCDDGNPEIYPGSTTHQEGVDYDCDGKKEYLATLIVTVDDEATEICANGVQLPLKGNHGNWTATDSYTFVLESGANAVGISGVDKGKVITAMAALLKVNGASYPTRGVPAGKIYEPTDPEWDKTPWRYFGKKVEEDKSGWCDAYFNDSTWGPAMAAAAANSPSTLVGQATPWGCGADLCTAFPEGNERPDWIWDPFPVDLQSAWIRLKVELP
jgi:hypothetical protein